MKEEAKENLPSRRYKKYYTYIDPIVADPVIRGYFTLVASLLLTAFFIFFALSPTFSTIVGLLRKIEDQKRIITRLDSKINNLILAQEVYSQIEAELPLLHTALPTRPLPESVLLDVLRVASQSAVKINAFQIGDIYLSGVNPEKESLAPSSQTAKNDLISSLGLPTVEFTLGIEGDKNQIREFAGKLQSLPRIMSLYVISIAQGLLTTNSNNFSADITGTAFYYPETKLIMSEPKSK